jgi:superfamily II DNA or RNA helicase
MKVHEVVMFRDLDGQLQSVYRSKHGDARYLLREFYIPCLERSIRMDRAVGYFTSNAIGSLPWVSLERFLQNEGRIRIICSPSLTHEDLDTIAESYQRREKIIESCLSETITRMLEGTEEQRHPAMILGYLIEQGRLEIKIATVSGGALFHEKIQVFKDSNEDYVVTLGSNNETGSAWLKNRDSFVVMKSWSKGTDAQDQVDYFERCWNGIEPGLDVDEFPDVAAALLKKHAYCSTEEIIDNEPPELRLTTEICLPELRDYQSEVLKDWKKNGHRGIVKHCTGSGKTVIALRAIVNWCESGKSVLILVPGKELKNQWVDELEKAIPNKCNVLECDGSNIENELYHTLAPGDEEGYQIAIVNYATACKPTFIKNLPSGNVLVVCDEVHKLGSAKNRHFMEYKAEGRLGLSATPEDERDPDRTKNLMDYFCSEGEVSRAILKPVLEIKEGIDEGFLAPYRYHVHEVYPNDEEAEEFNQLTIKIGILWAQYLKDASDSELKKRLEAEQFKRANLIKTLSEKVDKAESIIRETFDKNATPPQRWLVYCHSQVQLQELRRKIADLQPTELHSELLPAEREITLRQFEQFGGIVLCMRCLDEGVNVPMADHALIIASSQTKREYVQRRGRVLRQVTGRIKMAEIHDVVVMPDGISEEWVDKAEFARCFEFAKAANNCEAITVKLNLIRAKYGLGGDDVDVDTRTVEGEGVV